MQIGFNLVICLFALFRGCVCLRFIFSWLLKEQKKKKRNDMIIWTGISDADFYLFIYLFECWWDVGNPSGMGTEEKPRPLKR